MLTEAAGRRKLLEKRLLTPLPTLLLRKPLRLQQSDAIDEIQSSFRSELRAQRHGQELDCMGALVTEEMEWAIEERCRAGLNQVCDNLHQSSHKLSNNFFLKFSVAGKVRARRSPWRLCITSDPFFAIINLILSFIRTMFSHVDGEQDTTVCTNGTQTCPIVNVSLFFNGTTPVQIIKKKPYYFLNHNHKRRIAVSAD